jgi:MFS family permease
LWVYNHFHWQWLCGELAVLSIVMAIAAWRLPVLASAHPLVTPKVSEVWDWRVIHASLSLSAYSFGYGGVTSYAAIVAKERHIDPPAIYLTTFAVTVVVIRLTTSHLGDRIGPMRVLYPALALMPIAYALLAVAQTRWLYVTSAILFGTGLATAYPSFITFILGATDPARRARTFGSIVWAFDTGIGTGSLVIGAIGEHQGLRTAFLGAAMLACLSIPILAWASRRLRGTPVATLGET